MRALTLATLCVGACSGASPSPTSPQAGAGEVRPQEEAPIPPPSTATPLEGCSHVSIEATQSWSCGPHRVVRASHPNGLPPDRPGTWVGDPPETTALPVDIGGRVVEARAMTQPELDGARMVNVLLRDEVGGQIGSCSLRLERGQDAAGLLSWCAAALGKALATERDATGPG